MLSNVFHITICVFSLEVLGFNEIDHGQEAMEQGKAQYQLMEERGRLPRYGECWQSALKHVHQGCDHLSEETQSDIALHITNCFLAMSGHEIYNCELDKKPNLRGICINSMSDRAFNVYTEFYTHTQNICWFLRGQAWQEKMRDITTQVGKQLDISLEGQHQLLKQQKESLILQDRLLKSGHSLERILNESNFQSISVLNELLASVIMATKSISNLQSLLISEIAWFDSLVFYISSALICMILTSCNSTASAKLPLFILLTLNFVAESSISSWLSAESGQAMRISDTVHEYIWWCRRITMGIFFFILSGCTLTYRDYPAMNNKLLNNIQEQNRQIYQALEALKLSSGLNISKLKNQEGEYNLKETNISSPRYTEPDSSPISSLPKYKEASKFSSTSQMSQLRELEEQSCQKDNSVPPPTYTEVCPSPTPSLKYNLRTRATPHKINVNKQTCLS